MGVPPASGTVTSALGFIKDFRLPVLVGPKAYSGEPKVPAPGCLVNSGAPATGGRIRARHTQSGQRDDPLSAVKALAVGLDGGRLAGEVVDSCRNAAQ